MSKKSGIGVVVGRFQIDALSKDHKGLIDKANEHEKLLIMIGVPKEGKISHRNPLDYETRRYMMRGYYSEAVVGPVFDIPGDDKEWSIELDKSIKLLGYPLSEATIYGGRDSCLSVYCGMYPTSYYEGWNPTTNATKIREEIAKKPWCSPEFRAGIIYMVLNMKELE